MTESINTKLDGVIHAHAVIADEVNVLARAQRDTEARLGLIEATLATARVAMLVGYPTLSEPSLSASLRCRRLQRRGRPSEHQSAKRKPINLHEDARALPMSETIDEIAQRLIAMEHAALSRWCAGDPSGFLEISAADVVYFDPFIDRRIDGLSALTTYYEALRGKIRADRFEILNPHVQRVGDLAILTFNFVSFGGNENGLRWNCTEAYRLEPIGWRIIQTHWSFTNPKK